MAFHSGYKVADHILVMYRKSELPAIDSENIAFIVIVPDFTCYWFLVHVVIKSISISIINAQLIWFVKCTYKLSVTD